MENITHSNFEVSVLPGLFPEEISKLIPYFKKFKCAEIFKNISKGIFVLEKFTTLSIQERNYLSKNFFMNCTKVLEQNTDSDGTKKISLKLFDENVIEAVLLFDENGRKTACISSQAGCPLGCRFCKTGFLGFSRNLYVAEIVEQFFILENIAGKIDNVVFMGMGEPLLNLQNVVKAIKILCHKEGRNLSTRRITISTSGIIDGIRQLAKTLPEIRLAVSIITADEKLRKDLMPVTESNPLPELKNVLLDFVKKTKRRISLEFLLIHNLNTGIKFQKQAIEFAEGLNAHINLIPWNKISELDFETPNQVEVNEFFVALQKAKINVTVRQKRGSEISGACGQLGRIKF